MTLRARIAAIAGLSVALAVIAAAVGLYVAVRSDLRGEVDHQLRNRARAFTQPGAPAGFLGGPGGQPPDGSALDGRGGSLGGGPASE